MNLEGLADLSSATVHQDGSFSVGVAGLALCEGVPLVRAGTDLVWGGSTVGLVLTDGRWSDGILVVEAVAFEPLRSVLAETRGDVGLAFSATAITERVAGRELVVDVADARLGVLVRPGSGPRVIEVIEAVREMGGAPMGVFDDLQATFQELGLSEAAARHAAAGRDGVRPVALAELGVARPVPVPGAGVAKPTHAVPVVADTAPVSGAVQGLGEATDLVATFRDLGLSESAARHAARGR